MRSGEEVIGVFDTVADAAQLMRGSHIESIQEFNQVAFIQSCVNRHKIILYVIEAGFCGGDSVACPGTAR
jgi:hypothetical protein